MLDPDQRAVNIQQAIQLKQLIEIVHRSADITTRKVPGSDVNMMQTYNKTFISMAVNASGRPT